MEQERDFQHLPATPSPETWTTTQALDETPAPWSQFGVNDDIGLMLRYAIGGA